MLIKAYNKSKIRGKKYFHVNLQYFYGMCSITGVEFFILVSNMKEEYFWQVSGILRRLHDLNERFEMDSM